MALVQRLINVTFKLASGTFAESGTNTVTLSGLRMSVRCVKAGGPSMGKLQMEIFGMTLSLMNKLSTLGMKVQLVQYNSIAVSAGDADSGMGVVFEGNITDAWADFQSAPDIPFQIEAHTGLGAAVLSIPPSSFEGSADVATIMSGLATQAGYSFENNGVTTKLSNPYFSGSVRSQIKSCAEAAGIGWTIDSGGNTGVSTLVIWPKNGSRNGAVPLVSPETGMVGYPSYVSVGIAVKTLFNPSIGFMGKIQVKSQLTPACGTWTVYGMNYSLDSMVPNGDWFTELSCFNASFGAPVLK